MTHGVRGRNILISLIKVTFLISPLQAVRNSSVSCDGWHAVDVGSALLQRHAKTSSILHYAEVKFTDRFTAPQHVASTGADYATTSYFVRFLSSLAFNSIILLAHILFFWVARSSNPKIYCNGWLTGRAPFQPSDGFFGWAIACWRLSPEEVVAAAGLDAYMLLRFQTLGVNILAVLGLPMIFILCPLHYFAGAGESDPLSRINLSNVPDGSWLYWLHALVVWTVVVSVHRMLCAAQQEFMELRYTWLRELPYPRSNTCLVHHIPAEFCSDEKLTAYVNKMFMREVVERAHVTKKLPEHVSMEFQTLNLHRERLTSAEMAWKHTGNNPALRPKHLTAAGDETDSLDHFSRVLADHLEEYRSDQEAIMWQAKDGKFCGNSGFVTFKTRHDADMALVVRARANAEEIAFQMPPDSSDVRYDILQQSREQNSWRCFFGYVLMTLVFFSSFPAIVAISFVSSLDPLRNMFPVIDVIAARYPLTASFWDGVFGSVMLTFFIAFAPILLMSIIRNFMSIPAESWCQHRLQHVYYFFQLIFALVLFCVGNSIFILYIKVAKSPADILTMLVSSLPQSTNFYLNFFPLHWVSYFGQLCRYWVFVKYHCHRRAVDSDKASDLAEPEDQDCYGFGARSARLSLLLAIALVLCSMAPLICLLALITFFFSRTIYGYLLVFSETKKTDSGGLFWCTQLKHVHYALFLYVALMVGKLQQSGGHGPGLCTLLCFVFLIRVHISFDYDFPWAQLPFEEIADLQTPRTRSQAEYCYLQPELAPLPDFVPVTKLASEHSHRGSKHHKVAA